MDLLPPVGLVAVLGGFWGWAWIRERRFKAAVADLVVRFEGRYEPGSHTSGGTLFMKFEGRDVAFSFDRGSSRGPASTTASAIHRKTDIKPLCLKGSEAVAKAPRLGPYSKWHQSVVLRIEPTLVTAITAGMIVDAVKLVDLAAILTALAIEVEGAASPP